MDNLGYAPTKSFWKSRTFFVLLTFCTVILLWSAWFFLLRTPPSETEPYAFCRRRPTTKNCPECWDGKRKT